MADPRTFQFNLPTGRAPDDATLSERWYPGIQPFALQASNPRSVDPITGVRAIVIHATAGASSEGAASVIIAKKASFHWLVPDENEQAHGQFVWATCHEARRAWHVRNDKSHQDVYFGHTYVNDYSLGIEIVNNVTGTDTYSDWQVRATADIVRYCWAKYPNLTYIVSHAKLDPGRRTDPGEHFPWDTFKGLVLADQDLLGGGGPIAGATLASDLADGIDPSDVGFQEI